MMALDEFVLWVNADKPYKTAKEYIDAAKAANGTFKMGGTGSKQEDQIITVAIEKATGAKFTYIPYKGGGEVAVQLVGNHVDSTVNNPIEAVAHGAPASFGRCACSTARSSTTTTRSPATMSWERHPDLQVGRASMSST